MLRSRFRSLAIERMPRLSNGQIMNWRDLVSRLGFWGNRIGGYILLSFADDAAWIAFMFC